MENHSSGEGIREYRFYFFFFSVLSNGVFIPAGAMFHTFIKGVYEVGEWQLLVKLKRNSHSCFRLVKLFNFYTWEVFVPE